MTSLQHIINTVILAEDEPRPIKTWHVSKIGQCPTGVFLERLGVTPDTQFNEREYRLFYMGRQLELEIVRIAETYAKTHDLTVTTQKRVEDLKLGLSGKIDLIMDGEDGPWVYEIKSKHSRAFHYMDKKKEGPNRHHEYQLWLYLKMLNLPQGLLYYVSRDDLCHLEYPVYLNDQTLENEVMRELEILNQAWEKKIPPRCVYKDEWQAKYCRFHTQCLKYT